MKISKDYEWIRDYLELAKHLVPLKKITHIKFITPPNNLKTQLCHGMITRHENGTYSITLFRKHKSIDPITHTIVITPYSKLDILMYLSHELAHMKFFEQHCPKHKKLELKIHNRFITKLKNSGYISEEHDVAQQKKSEV